MIDRPEDLDTLPVIEMATLDQRHPGLTPEIAASFAQAAAICFSRHHESPASLTVTADDTSAASYPITWKEPTQRERNSWANADDATRDGAYCVVLAVAEQHLGLVALSRTPVGSGADYWMAPSDMLRNPVDGLIDYESALRLEVSGMSLCRDERALEDRVRQKARQVRAGSSSSPALAGVVAFNMLRVVFRSVE